VLAVRTAVDAQSSRPNRVVVDGNGTDGRAAAGGQLRASRHEATSRGVNRFIPVPVVVLFKWVVQRANPVGEEDDCEVLFAISSFLSGACVYR
jgi:hypothetical protein